MRYLFIQNPISGQNSVQKCVQRVVERLRNDGVDVIELHTKQEGDAENFAISMQHYKPLDLIVAVGGDGTVNEIVNGLYLNYAIDAIPPIAIIPAGTVNDFANHFKLPVKESSIYQYLKTYDALQVDIGNVNSRFFTNVVAAGYISDVGYKVKRKHKKRFGRFAYYSEGIYEALKYLKQSNRFSFKMAEHEVSLDAYMFIALNTTFLGGLSYFAPTANCEDGFLDLFIIKKTGLIGGFMLLIKILLGKHIDDKNVIYFKIKSFQVDSNHQIDVDVDGEKGSSLPLTVKVHKQLLKLAVPKID